MHGADDLYDLSPRYTPAEMQEALAARHASYDIASHGTNPVLLSAQDLESYSDQQLKDLFDIVSAEKSRRDEIAAGEALQNLPPKGIVDYAFAPTDMLSKVYQHYKAAERHPEIALARGLTTEGLDYAGETPIEIPGIGKVPSKTLAKYAKYVIPMATSSLATPYKYKTNVEKLKELRRASSYAARYNNILNLLGGVIKEAPDTWIPEQYRPYSKPLRMLGTYGLDYIKAKENID